MLCRVCREDLDKSMFDGREYSKAVASAQCPCCIECAKLPKKERKARTSVALSRIKTQDAKAAENKIWKQLKR